MEAKAAEACLLLSYLYNMEHLFMVPVNINMFAMKLMQFFFAKSAVVHYLD
jgi:hypothetical protein